MVRLCYLVQFEKVIINHALEAMRQYWVVYRTCNTW